MAINLILEPHFDIFLAEIRQKKVLKIDVAARHHTHF